jgi:Nucleotidyltransferase substrate binding protein like
MQTIPRAELVSTRNTMRIQLDLSSLDNALHRLAEALQAYSAEPTNSLYRDACILRFKISYERAYKMLQRYFTIASSNPTQISPMSFPDLIRNGSEQGLLCQGWNHWNAYRKAVTERYQIFDENKTTEFMQIAPVFLIEGQALLRELQQRSSA